MTQIKANFNENFLRLKYSTEHKCLYFKEKSEKKDFIQYMDKKVFQREDLKVNCDRKTFSARDGASARFIESDFYMNMLESIGYGKNSDIIKNMKGFKKIDINYDAFCGGDRLLERRVKKYPWEFVNSQTPVCYIFEPSFRDEKYQYDLYVKLAVRGNEVNVMSLHWGDPSSKDKPREVWNYKEKKMDKIEDVEEFLENKINSKDYEYER